jgi:hypothetical protein
MLKYQLAYNYDSNIAVAATIWSPGSNHEKKFLRATLKKKTYIFYLAFFSVVHPEGEEPFGSVGC